MTETAPLAMDATSHLDARAAISAHFAGRTSPVPEAGMRVHLSACAECRDCYRRHHLLARLVPDALTAEERIARGLGFGRRRTSGRPRWLVFGAPFVGAAAAAALVLSLSSAHLRGGPVGGAVEEPVARGAATAGAPRLLIYRFNGGRPALVDGEGVGDRSMGGHDELAFAYSNPTGRRYVAIFGVDEHGRVYWFHPAWPAGAPAPGAIAAASGPEPHELPEAIRHQFTGRRLTMQAAFADRPLAADEIEAAVRTGAHGNTLASRLGEGVLVTERVLDVRP